MTHVTVKLTKYELLRIFIRIKIEGKKSIARKRMSWMYCKIYTYEQG